MTEILQIDSDSPQASIIERAADLIRRGELVVIPTETVYGLGANALDSRAIEKIYAAKGRPSHNPLIVHVASVAQAQQCVTQWPKIADELAAHFWPGPLTIILPKAASIPSITTAGGATVALRIPNHRVALALIERAGVPIAAPSANRSTMLSPTSAEHVRNSLGDHVSLILDAGPTSGGIESTVIDLSGNVPRLLRPGLVSPDQLRELLPNLEIVKKSAVHGNSTDSQNIVEPTDPLASPGLMERHYAPRTPMECWRSESDRRVKQLCEENQKVAWLKFPTSQALQHPNLHTIEMPNDPRDYAAQLYATLHSLDQMNLDIIVIELPPNTEDWLAVRDRLRRGAKTWNE